MRTLTAHLLESTELSKIDLEMILARHLYRLEKRSSGRAIGISESVEDLRSDILAA